MVLQLGLAIMAFFTYSEDRKGAMNYMRVWIWICVLGATGDVLLGYIYVIFDPDKISIEIFNVVGKLAGIIESVRVCFWNVRSDIMDDFQ